MLLPTMMVCLALLVQPALLLYTRCVMESAAAEGCRVLTTMAVNEPLPETTFRSYMLRRLSAVPNADVFHVGGRDGWEIVTSWSDGAHEVGVTIRTEVAPLPFFGLGASLLGAVNASGNVELEVEVAHAVRPDWLEGGSDDWLSTWQ